MALVFCGIAVLIAIGSYVAGHFGTLHSPESIKILQPQSPPLLQASLPTKEGGDKKIELGSGNTHIIFERKDIPHCTYKDEGQVLRELNDLTPGKACREFSVTIAPEEVRYLQYFKKKIEPKRFILTSFNIEPEEDISAVGDINLRLLRLDPDSDTPQIIVDGYTGGAHCCVVSALLWQSKYKKWHILDLPGQDGDSSIPTVVGSDMRTLLKIYDNSFLDAYASYASSYAPNQLLALNNGHLLNVTTQKEYRDILLNDMRDLINEKETEGHCSFMHGPEGYNAFLAYYVASFANLGHLQDAWAYMLLHHDQSGQTMDDFPSILKHDLVVTADNPLVAKGQKLVNNYIPAAIAAKLPMKIEDLSPEMREKYRDIGSLFALEPSLAALVKSCSQTQTSPQMTR